MTISKDASQALRHELEALITAAETARADIEAGRRLNCLVLAKCVKTAGRAISRVPTIRSWLKAESRKTVPYLFHDSPFQAVVEKFSSRFDEPSSDPDVEAWQKVAECRALMKVFKAHLLQRPTLYSLTPYPLSIFVDETFGGWMLDEHQREALDELRVVLSNAMEQFDDSRFYGYAILLSASDDSITPGYLLVQTLCDRLENEPEFQDVLRSIKVCAGELITEVECHAASLSMGKDEVAASLARPQTFDPVSAAPTPATATGTGFELSHKEMSSLTANQKPLVKAKRRDAWAIMVQNLLARHHLHSDSTWNEEGSVLSHGEIVATMNAQLPPGAKRLSAAMLTRVMNDLFSDDHLSGCGKYADLVSTPAGQSLLIRALRRVEDCSDGVIETIPDSDLIKAASRSAGDQHARIKSDGRAKRQKGKWESNDD